MSRRLVISVVVLALVGVVTAGSAATLNVTAKRLTVVDVAGTGPLLQTLEMFDDDTDGRIDRVLASFDRALATPYTAGTAGWTLTGVPSGGTLSGVTVAGAAATLALTEGTGAPNTASSGFMIGLAATAGGVRDSSGALASFAALMPLDEASPVPVALATTVAGTRSGEMQANDAIEITFSEPLRPASIVSSATVTQSGGAGSAADQMSIPGITNGSLSLGDNKYITTTGSASFANSGVSLLPADVTVRVTVGPACSSPCPTGRGKGAFVYAPAPAIQDVALNPATGTFTTAASFEVF